MRIFYLFTNRNCIVFDHDDTQDIEAQQEIGCYQMGRGAQSVLDSCDQFYISRWGDWYHEVTKKEIEYLLGLRTRERDLEELEEAE